MRSRVRVPSSPPAFLSGCKAQRDFKSYRPFHIHIFHNPLTIFDAAIRLSAEIAGEVVMNAGIDFGTSKLDRCRGVKARSGGNVQYRPQLPATYHFAIRDLFLEVREEDFLW